MRFLTLVASLIFTLNAHADLTIYTDRTTVPYIASVFNETYPNVKVNIVNMNWKDLKAAMAAGQTADADLIFVKDLMYLNELQSKGSFQAMPAELTGLVRPEMRGPNNSWAAVTFRARTLVYESSLDVSGINSYEDLSKEDYRGTLCLRTSNHDYNRALAASLISNYGEAKAGEILKGLVQNRVEDIYYTDDTSIIKQIATGAKSADGSSNACYLGITNSYYLGAFLAQEPNAPVKIKFLKNGQKGVHTNGTGVGIAATSKQPKVAADFIKVMLSEAVQVGISNETQEYPAVISVVPQNQTLNFPAITGDTTSWSAFSQNVEKAMNLFVKANYL